MGLSILICQHEHRETGAFPYALETCIAVVPVYRRWVVDVFLGHGKENEMKLRAENCDSLSDMRAGPFGERARRCEVQVLLEEGK